MSAPLLPTTSEVGKAWLMLATVGGVHVDDDLPTLAELPALATVGAIRLTGTGGSPDRYTPMRSPILTAECWVAASDTTRRRAWHLAGQLAERLVASTYDPALMGVVVDLPGDYRSARVHTVTALSDPDRIEDEGSGWVRVDLDLELLWTSQ